MSKSNTITDDNAERKELDPYSAWLDIAPGLRPPCAQKLLGVSPGEMNEPTILEAAMRRKKRLDEFALSEHSRVAAESP